MWVHVCTEYKQIHNCFFDWQEQGVTTFLVINRCNNSIYFIVFCIVAVSYISILQAIALVFACLIRKVKIDALNDSRETRAVIYISAVIIVVYFSILFTLYQFEVLIDLAWAFTIFIGSILILGFTFIPKVFVYSCMYAYNQLISKHNWVDSILTLTTSISCLYSS